MTPEPLPISPEPASSTARWLALPALVHADLSPDGSTLVVTVASVPLGSDEERLQLQLIDVATGFASAVRAAWPGDHTGVWSRDGSALAFVTDRTGTSQLAVWKLGEAEAEPTVVTALPAGVMGPASWSPDGRLVVAGRRGRSIDRTRPWRITRAVQWGDGVGALDDPLQLWVCDPATGEYRMITDDEWRWTLPRWSPDGTRVAARASFDPTGQRRGQHLRLVDPAADGEWTTPEVPGGFSVVPAWAADSLLVLSFQPEGSPGGSEAQLHQVLPDGEVTRLDTSSPVALGGTVYGDSPAAVGEAFENALTIDGDGVYIRTQRGGRMGVVRLELDTGRWDELVTGTRCASPLGAVGNTLVIAEQAADRPCRIAIVDTASGECRDLAPPDANPPPTAEVYRWTVESPHDGAPLDAWHLRPRGAEGPLPTVVLIHGGPNAAFGECINLDAQALCAAGLGVIYTNPHGSTGSGDQFTHAVFDHWGDIPSLDVLAVVDDATERGWVDPGRLGVSGNSYGGYLTTWLACTTRRFRAAVAENPAIDLVSLYGTSDIGATFLPMQFGTSPHHDAGPFLRWSPLFRAATCNTPMLFVVGTDDRRCPPSQALEMHRVLHTFGKASEILVLPDSSHEGSTYGPPAARLAHNEALVEWMQRWLGS